MEFFPAEVAVSCLAPGLRHCVRLLEELDGVPGHSASSWRERVQGGSSAPAAERRVELMEELQAMPPRLVKIAERLRGYPPRSERGRYVAALLGGCSGSDLKQAAKLSKRAMNECRGWLKGFVE